MAVLNLMNVGKEVEYSESGSPIWWTASGQPIAVDEMDDDHLERACQYVFRDGFWGQAFSKELKARGMDPIYVIFKESDL